MRLLHTTNLELKEFFDQNIPEYAILSHRWEAEEVSLQDFNAIRKLEDPRFAPLAEFLKLSMTTTKESAGYMKIVACCDLAAFWDYQWVWIDTCCIDKTSSTDLSEAINSMYQWYKRAGTCFAYLSDVKVTVSAELSGAVQELAYSPTWMEETEEAYSRLQQCQERWESLYETNQLLSVEFVQSQWFTRGWTLQELLAPNSVVFVNQGWSVFGGRSTLASTVHAVTGIPASALQGTFRSREHNVAQKMCWASARTTSRIEDIAYCLLGLFDVKMPLLYGEGTRAFHRLQEEILRNSGDETLFVWPRYSQPSSLLAVSPRMFADCASIVATPEIQRAPSIIVNQLLQMDVHLLHIGDYAGLKLSRKLLDGEEYKLVPLRCRVEPLHQRLAYGDWNVVALILLYHAKKGPLHRVFDCVRLNVNHFFWDENTERKTIYISLS